MSNHPKQRSSSLQPQIFKNKGWGGEGISCF